MLLSSSRTTQTKSKWQSFISLLLLLMPKVSAAVQRARAKNCDCARLLRNQSAAGRLKHALVVCCVIVCADGVACERGELFSAVVGCQWPALSGQRQQVRASARLGSAQVTEQRLGGASVLAQNFHSPNQTTATLWQDTFAARHKQRPAHYHLRSRRQAHNAFAPEAILLSVSLSLS